MTKLNWRNQHFKQWQSWIEGTNTLSNDKVELKEPTNTESNDKIELKEPTYVANIPSYVTLC